MQSHKKFFTRYQLTSLATLNGHNFTHLYVLYLLVVVVVVVVRRSLSRNKSSLVVSVRASGIVVGSVYPGLEKQNKQHSPKTCTTQHNTTRVEKNAKITPSPVTYTLCQSVPLAYLLANSTNYPSLLLSIDRPCYDLAS